MEPFVSGNTEVLAGHSCLELFKYVLSATGATFVTIPGLVLVFQEAHVVCHQLGYTGASKVVSNRYIMCICILQFFVLTLLPWARRRRRVKHSGLSYMCVCVCTKNAAVYCLTAQRLSWNSSQQLGCWIFILWKTPAKSRKSPVACYGRVFLLTD